MTPSDTKDMLLTALQYNNIFYNDDLLERIERGEKPEAVFQSAMNFAVLLLETLIVCECTPDSRSSIVEQVYEVLSQSAGSGRTVLRDRIGDLTKELIKAGGQ